MTRSEAKTLCLEICQYLADHPEIHRKRDLPSELWVKIQSLNHACPLCEIFWGNENCEGCSLGSCDTVNFLYCQWMKGNTQNIVDTLKAWEV